ncbi:MAG: enoyl-CoA hydratase/isomerase family protein [Myxococcales bacterium]|nr:enoyl-CoA hydratase/isomerase family protein [Myxococcales bacterium]
MSVLVAKQDHVATVTLNRPDARNALSRDVNERLIAIAAELAADDDVRVCIITGAGEQAFCAGADLKERKGVTAAQTAPYLEAIAGACNAWAGLAKPTIAAMNGSAYGGGLELALACDFRLGVVGSEVGLTEVRLGIMPGAGGTQRLPRIVGVAAAKELIMLGRRISNERAAAMGVLNEVAPRGEFAALVQRYVDDLLACAPLSVKMAKAAIERGLHLPLAEALAVERASYEVTLFSEDRNEGLAAFAEKRPPRFSGK